MSILSVPIPISGRKLVIRTPVFPHIEHRSTSLPGVTTGILSGSSIVGAQATGAQSV
jgi:hypothetical protein